ncbi:MAG: hypothetical protein LBC82_00860 [Oscillospiraceae bacterium]|jgi:hypothetical protein|nr:hypothetical protein [Oscillospiraceae bacterium]
MKSGLTEIIVLHDNNVPVENFEELARKNGKIFLETMKKAQGEGEIRITLGAFGDGYKFYTNDTPVAAVRLTTKHFGGGDGVRNVFDSIAETINEKGKAYSDADESEHPENVIVVLTTFGRDNASKSFTYNQVAEMVAHQSYVYKWKFFCMTNESLIMEQLGILPEHTILFDIEEENFFAKALAKLSERIIDVIRN